MRCLPNCSTKGPCLLDVISFTHQGRPTSWQKQLWPGSSSRESLLPGIFSQSAGWWRMAHMQEWRLLIKSRSKWNNKKSEPLVVVLSRGQVGRGLLGTGHGVGGAAASQLGHWCCLPPAVSCGSKETSWLAGSWECCSVGTSKPPCLLLINATEAHWVVFPPGVHSSVRACQQHAWMVRHDGRRQLGC